jgi:hypothetical protein
MARKVVQGANLPCIGFAKYLVHLFLTLKVSLVEFLCKREK